MKELLCIMRPCLLMFLLLLSVLIHDAHGRRLIRTPSNKGYESIHGLHILHEKLAKLNKSIDEGETKNGSGCLRQLTLIHTTIAKKGEMLKPEGLASIGREKQNIFVNSSSKDILEMDYTLSRRKPPIHN
ncbi:hypothetical protein SASPL_126944 [Salvia splendens]|uniref:Uncharacterized protein n=1 Tax=Salvia splendens TaxID=180675 RepID=A0A8X8XMR9_SALSN|nr:uncharacterized protein LOC121747639 isoform X2 [Salvia splendens]KAG6414226.1 hypothetical protein SASPL_126944 [Salvia splendens]